MKRSHAQTGALLAAGLAAALVVHFWPMGNAKEAVPALSESPSASASPSATISASPTISAVLPTASTPAPVSPTPSPSHSESALTGEPSTPEPDETQVTLPEVSGVVVKRNNARSVMVRWDGVPTATRYVVYSNGAVIARVSETMAIFIWETDELRIGVAAETRDGVGPVSTIRVQRPAESPTTAAPAPVSTPSTVTSETPDPQPSTPAATPSETTGAPAGVPPAQPGIPILPTQDPTGNVDDSEN
jgi:hypothetical protein